KETPPEHDVRGPINLALIVDCQSEQLAASPIHTVPEDGMPPTILEAFKLTDLKPAPTGTYLRFVIAVCVGELAGVHVLPARTQWVHFLEGFNHVLNYVRDSPRKVGKYRAASVRLQELGLSLLPDGRVFDAREAVWVFDCERKLGAVAYERVLARDRTVTSKG